ncbi:MULTISPECIES: SURF1 family protein [unclassified Actinotalea]|uniref:SURF1 family cytochrome oxidase biogenesis protein n=1 Tax=unclassified Actinotalea TaxID=2638618 RepID=UPI0021054390|nr:MULTISPECIES: SURF1 family protein [unclassified Actinotalea]
MRQVARTLLVALVVAVGCTGAGLWQWGRHEDRSAAIALVQANYDAAPVPLADLLGPGEQLDPADVWRPVRVRGTYLPAPVLLRNRPVDGQAGFHVLVPLVLQDDVLAGSVLVVDRGWVPLGDDSTTAEVPALPGGPVDVVVRLRPGERASARDAPAGQVQAINADQVRDAALGTLSGTGRADAGDWPADATLRAYGAVASEDGARPEGLGALPAPSTDPGSHLSYAFQWWVFALGALGTGVVLAVRVVREGDPDDVDQPDAETPGGTRPAGTSGQGSRRRRPTAEEEEDALLDAQDAGRPADVRSATP